MPTFTQATPAENDMIAAMMRDFYAEEHYPFSAKNLVGLATLLATPDPGFACLIHDEAALAGYFILTFCFSVERGGKIALLDELYIRPAFRRKGLGKAAIEYATEQAQRSDCKAILLEVDHVNTAARSVYVRAGFEALARDLMVRLISSQQLH